MLSLRSYTSPLAIVNVTCENSIPTPMEKIRAGYGSLVSRLEPLEQWCWVKPESRPHEGKGEYVAPRALCVMEAPASAVPALIPLARCAGMTETPTTSTGRHCPLLPPSTLSANVQP